jgi:hypothetical protein
LEIFFAKISDSMALPVSSYNTNGDQFYVHFKCGRFVAGGKFRGRLWGCSLCWGRLCWGSRSGRRGRLRECCLNEGPHE